MKYEIIIIGGGTAGLMAAVAAGERSSSVLLIDKGNKLGRKLGISGGGRCNVTNAMELDELIRHIPGNGRFLYSALSSFGNRDIIGFFESMGIALKEEDRGRMFPVTDKAKTVVDALVGKVRSLGVHIRTNSPVTQILYQCDLQSDLQRDLQHDRDDDRDRNQNNDNRAKVHGVMLQTGEILQCRSVIIATGGKSVPHTGSTGDGYPWAIEAGHTITPLFPTEVPLTSTEKFIASRELQGLALRDVTLSVLNEKGKAIVSHRGDLLFTHFGLSGPITLRCSQFAVKQLAKGVQSVPLVIDLLPDQTVEQIYATTLNMAQNESRKAIINVLKGYLPERILPVLLSRAKLDTHLTFDHIPHREWRELALLIKSFAISIQGSLSIEEAFITGGGVNLKEIDPKTMQSKRMPGLFFCGEVLDIHGYTGGYNITAAFSTGYTAGTHAAALAL